MQRDNIEFGAKIRSMREGQRLSRERLAELADISTQFLADIENGKKGMSAVTLKKLCSALHTSTDSILFGSAEEKYPDLNAVISRLPADKGMNSFCLRYPFCALSPEKLKNEQKSQPRGSLNHSPIPSTAKRYLHRPR